MLSVCASIYFIVPKPGREREKVIHEGIQVVSYPVQQAVVCLHPADGVLDRDTDGRLFAILFLLGWRQAWIWGFLGFPGFLVRQTYPGFWIILVGPQKTQVQPQPGFLEPGQARLENLFHQRVIVDTPRHDAEQEKYPAVQARDDQ